MLSNAYFLAKFRFDTAENEPAKNLQNFRKMHFRKMHFRKMPDHGLVRVLGPRAAAVRAVAELAGVDVELEGVARGDLL